MFIWTYSRVHILFKVKICVLAIILLSEVHGCVMILKWGHTFKAITKFVCFREAVLGRFVCSTIRFIPHEPRKKTLIPYIYNASNKDPFLKFSEKSDKFKIPPVMGTEHLLMN